MHSDTFYMNVATEIAPGRFSRDTWRERSFKTEDAIRCGKNSHVPCTSTAGEDKRLRLRMRDTETPREPAGTFRTSFALENAPQERGVLKLIRFEQMSRGTVAKTRGVMALAQCHGPVCKGKGAPCPITVHDWFKLAPDTKRSCKLCAWARSRKEHGEPMTKTPRDDRPFYARRGR